MARPERIRNAQLRRLISERPPWVLVMKTMPQAIRSTTTVRTAVARVELTPSMPSFARMEVRAAKTDEPSAKRNHIAVSSGVLQDGLIVSHPAGVAYGENGCACVFRGKRV